MVLSTVIATTAEKMEEDILEFVGKKGSATPFDIVKELDTYPMMEILRIALEMTRTGSLLVCQGDQAHL